MRFLTIAISAGDYNGIGPEVIIKSLSNPKIREDCKIAIFGSKEIFQLTFERFNAAQQSQFTSGLTAVLKNLISSTPAKIVNETDFKPGLPTRESGNTAYRYLSEAVEFWKSESCDCIVTAPITKWTFFPPGSPYSGQTEWLADNAGSDGPHGRDTKNGTGRSIMIMVMNFLRVGLVTTHLSVRDIPENLSVDIIYKKGELFYNSLTVDFGVENPKIAVCGLNPHSGENGTIGDEEKKIIEPAVEELKKLGGQWSGPMSADTLFTKRNREKFDGILALYHDQGLIPFKMYSDLKGVNFTAGLPLVRTSPDHGVAMDLAGKGLADHCGFTEALQLAKKITIRRKKNSGQN